MFECALLASRKNVVNLFLVKFYHDLGAWRPRAGEELSQTTRAVITPQPEASWKIEKILENGSYYFACHMDSGVDRMRLHAFLKDYVEVVQRVSQ